MIYPPSIRALRHDGGPLHGFFGILRPTAAERPTDSIFGVLSTDLTCRRVIEDILPLSGARAGRTPLLQYLCRTVTHTGISPLCWDSCTNTATCRLDASLWGDNEPLGQGHRQLMCKLNALWHGSCRDFPRGSV